MVIAELPMAKSPPKTRLMTAEELFWLPCAVSEIFA